MAPIQNYGPLISVIIWFFCFFCGAFLALGRYAKLSQGKKLWWDDCIVMFSWTCLFVESIITQMSINIGFGRHYYSIHPQANLLTIALYASVGASVSCFASATSKVASGVTLLRLTSGWYKVFVWFAVVTLTVFMLPSASITWLKCHPLEKNFNRQMEGACWDKSITLNYGILSAAWCAFMNFALALIPWKLIWKMRLERHDKICVCFALSLEWLPGVCVIRGVYLVQLEEGDFFFNGKDVTIWTAVETATAIIGSSIPNSNQNSDDVELNTYHRTIGPVVVAGTLDMQGTESTCGMTTDIKELEAGGMAQETDNHHEGATQEKPVDRESQTLDRTEAAAKSHEAYV
ncbi:hypothetical protein CSUB01_10646 [Colletotrichum sublineola]|uniref:Rhodopsin domain-containing protein n=1 Tax=Colletotrichum sublineola TaxID=1173701 RepID=A0A066XJB2_COLSU|nr:hypothetical protein CSUB01_10646 [Colletotrichum sublineola]